MCTYLLLQVFGLSLWYGYIPLHHVTSHHTRPPHPWHSIWLKPFEIIIRPAKVKAKNTLDLRHVQCDFHDHLTRVATWRRRWYFARASKVMRSPFSSCIARVIRAANLNSLSNWNLKLETFNKLVYLECRGFPAIYIFNVYIQIIVCRFPNVLKSLYQRPHPRCHGSLLPWHLSGKFRFSWSFSS